MAGTRTVLLKPAPFSPARFCLPRGPLPRATAGRASCAGRLHPTRFGRFVPRSPAAHPGSFVLGMVQPGGRSSVVGKGFCAGALSGGPSGFGEDRGFFAAAVDAGLMVNAEGPHAREDA